MRAPRDVAKAVVRLPRDFEFRGDVSLLTLLKDSGYIEEHGSVGVQLIEDVLREQPEVVADWIQYSDDKRCSSGWFLRQGESGAWEVGYVNRGAFDEVTSCLDVVAACALFVKKEIETLRSQR